MDAQLTRRRFFQVLAASVFAAGVPLPIGLRRESVLFVNGVDLTAFTGSLRGVRGMDGRSWATAYSTLSAALGRLEPGGAIYVGGTLPEEDVTLEFSSDPKRITRLWGDAARRPRWGGGKFTGYGSFSNFDLVDMHAKIHLKDD